MNSSQKASRFAPRGTVPPAQVSIDLRKYMAEVGDTAASESLGVSRQALARVAAGLSVNSCVLDCVRRRLGARDGGELAAVGT